MEGQVWLEKLRATLGLRKPSPVDPDWPEWYRKYYEVNREKPAERAPVAELSIAVVDAETTGLDHRQDQILSLGALRVRGNVIYLADKFETYLPTPAEFSDAPAVSIHGIIPNSRRYSYVEEESMLENVLAYLGNCLIVGHHIGFDVEMIDRALARHGAGPLKNTVLDTGKLARRLQPTGYWTPERDFTLDALARRYQIPLSDRHTALGDCYITAVLWLKLMSRLKTRLGREVIRGDL